MKKLFVFLFLCLLIISCYSVSVLALVSGAEPPKAYQPLFITNAGQGPGGKMARLLVIRSKAVEEWTYNAEPREKELNEKPYKTLLIVIGSSAKGLGASGITIDDEIARLEIMIKEAKRLNMQIIAAHIEGTARRDNERGPNERSIDAVAPFADYIIVQKDGNADGRFTKIAEENKIPLTIIDNTLDLIQVIEKMYPKPRE